MVRTAIAAIAAVTRPILQQGHEAARGFFAVTAALRGPDHHPGDLGRTGDGTARRQCRLRCPRHRAGSTHADHPVARSVDQPWSKSITHRP